MSDRERDPWGDLAWSEGEAASAGGAPASGSLGPRAAHAAGAADAAAASDGPTTAGESPTCPWCATPAAEGSTRCGSCGAALAQRESIGDLVVPGLTAVDPALKDVDGRPLHLRGPSPTQGAASGIIIAAAAGGPMGLAILGGVGALAAAEYMGAGGEKGRGHATVGQTSDAVLQALARLERGEALPAATDTTPRPELDSTTTAGAQSADPGAAGGATDGVAGAGPNRLEESSDGG